MCSVGLFSSFSHTYTLQHMLNSGLKCMFNANCYLCPNNTGSLILKRKKDKKERSFWPSKQLIFIGCIIFINCMSFWNLSQYVMGVHTPMIYLLEFYTHDLHTWVLVNTPAHTSWICPHPYFLYRQSGTVQLSCLFTFYLFKQRSPLPSLSHFFLSSLCCCW